MIDVNLVVKIAVFTTFLVLWVITSYRDWKFQRIDNSIIILGWLVVAGLYPFRMISIPPMNLIGYLSLSFTVAVFLWYINIWPAGDAKLFVLLSILMLMGLPTLHYPYWVLCFFQLVNIFTIAAFMMLLPLLLTLGRRSITLMWRKKIKNLLSSIMRGIRPPAGSRGPNPLHDNLSFIVFMICFGIVCYHLVQGYIRGSAILIITVLLWIIAKPIRQIVWRGPGKIWKISSAFFLAFGSLLYTLGPTDFNWLFMQNLGWSVIKCLCIAALFISLDYCLEKQETFEIPLTILKSHVILSDSFIQKMTQHKDFDEKNFGRMYPDGLTLDQSHEVAAWCRKNGLDTIAVCRAHPFAFWIFLGTLVTLLTQQDMISCLRRIL